MECNTLVLYIREHNLHIDCMLVYIGHYKYKQIK